jgi:hypothetical protein
MGVNVIPYYPEHTLVCGGMNDDTRVRREVDQVDIGKHTKARFYIVYDSAC